MGVVEAADEEDNKEKKPASLCKGPPIYPLDKEGLTSLGKHYAKWHLQIHPPIIVYSFSIWLIIDGG